jgi:hypothetical protein
MKSKEDSSEEFNARTIGGQKISVRLKVENSEEAIAGRTF